MQPEELARRAVEIAVDKMGESVRVLDVGDDLAITDYFVLVSVASRRQAQAVASAIDVEMKHAGVPKARIEGYDAGWWVLLDFDTVVVHVFQGEAREFYDLDQLWADATDLSSKMLGDRAPNEEAESRLAPE